MRKVVLPLPCRERRTCSERELYRKIKENIMKLKKTLALGLVAAMAASFTACGSTAAESAADSTASGEAAAEAADAE